MIVGRYAEVPSVPSILDDVMDLVTTVDSTIIMECHGGCEPNEVDEEDYQSTRDIYNDVDSTVVRRQDDYSKFATLI